jgi:diguanylate cyclase (GGDEF)-like protein/putative nucleotidyltransferase with HDIG domain
LITRPCVWFASRAARRGTLPRRGKDVPIKPEVLRRLDAAIDGLLPLPVFGGTVGEVQRLAVDDAVSTEDLIAVIQRDEAFTTNVLGYANSAAHARPVRVSSVRQAVTLLGRRALGRLATEAATYRFLELAAGTGGASRGQLHLHAVAVANCAVAAAERAGVRTDDVHLAALLHDIGKLVLPVAFSDAEVDAIAAAAPVGVARARLEHEELGVDHAYAGAVLARRSGAAETVAAAIQLHHGGRSGQECPSPEVACIQVANATVHLLAGEDPGEELAALALRTLGLEPAVLDEIAQSAAMAAPQPSERGSLGERVAQLERLSSIDDLTGLANRRTWLQRTAERLAADAGGAVLICDVDHFKRINDTFGHRAGDLVLADVARVLERHGEAGRLGGDEFAVWVAGAAEDGERAAESIVSDCRDLSEQAGAISVSIGVAVAPEHGTDITSLLETADRSLYAAKSAGRDGFVSAR